MSKPPPVPPANQTHKGPGYSDAHAADADNAKDHKHPNANEQGQTANIKQNTTNKGYFQGRRVK